MFPIDNEIRKKVISCEGNVVISASAGTGKTHTTILRILSDMERNQNFRTFAAVTFTKKAAKEILKRLGPNKGDGFVGTNDNFVWTEIIQPFMYDVYGSEFKRDINPDYSNKNMVRTFDSGIDKIRDTGLMCKLSNKKKNFAFQLALDILVKSHSAKRYLKSKYYRIYIDEYQDSDEDMHKFFMYLSDELCIPLFIVGDEKQSIYAWRGAYRRGFTSLFTKDSFELFVLKHNFRSDQAIQNYSNIFMKSVRHYYEVCDFNDEITILKYNSVDDACDFISGWIKENEKCAMLNYKKNVASAWSDRLNDKGLQFVYVPSSPLDYSDIESEHIWISRGIADFVIKHRYSEYDFRDEIPIPETYRVAELRKHLVRIKESVADYGNFEALCYKFYSYLGYEDVTEKVKNEVKVLNEVVTDEQYISTYNQEHYTLTSGTIHSSKGLEFSQVIINARDYDFRESEAKQLHYVAVTRPKNRLLILAKEGTVFDRYSKYIETAVKRTNELDINISIEDVIKVEES